jgi:hypothetical protein
VLQLVERAVVGAGGRVLVGPAVVPGAAVAAPSSPVLFSVVRPTKILLLGLDLH